MVTLREGSKRKGHRKHSHLQDAQPKVELADLLHHPAPEVPQPIVGRTIFCNYQGMTLCKFKGDKETFVFVVPSYIEEWEKKILDYGIMIAYRRGTDVWREMDDERSPRHKEYNNLTAIHTHEKARCKDKIEIHYEFMMKFEDAKKHVENGFPFLTIEERAGISKPFTRPHQEPGAQERVELPKMPEEQKAAGREIEMWRGRAVFRTEAGKPYHREDVKCCQPGCKNKIELRSYIRHNKQRVLTSVTAKAPADDDVVIVEHGGRTKDYKCSSCAAGVPPQHKVELTAEQKEMAKSLKLFTVDNLILNDLKRLAENHSELVDGEMLRGAVLMGMSLLLVD